MLASAQADEIAVFVGRPPGGGKDRAVAAVWTMTTRATMRARGARCSEVQDRPQPGRQASRGRSAGHGPQELDAALRRAARD